MREGNGDVHVGRRELDSAQDMEAGESREEPAILRARTDIIGGGQSVTRQRWIREGRLVHATRRTRDVCVYNTGARIHAMSL